MEFEEAVKIAKQNIGSIITRDEKGDFIVLLKGISRQKDQRTHKDTKTDLEKERCAFLNVVDINKQIEAIWASHECINVDNAQQIETMWANYESEIREQKRIISDALGKEKNNHFKTEKLDFASSDDIREIIEEEIEEKLQYIEANECRAYISSTF